MDRPVIRLSRVEAAYEGERAATLRDIDLSVREGELLGIVGPNGAGKTTLLDVIDGLLPVVRGDVRVFGEEMGPDAHRLRRSIGYVPQDLFFSPSTPYLVRDVVLMARFGELPPFRFVRRADREALAEALAAVGLAPLSRRPIGRISGGQQRKALLARALAQRARLLLLDEPTANLDPEAKADIEHLVVSLKDELSSTALVVSHEAGYLRDHAGRIVTIVEGRIVTDRPAGKGGSG